MVLWTSLIRGYVENGQGGHAPVTSKGQGMDVVITKKGLLESNVIVGTVLLNMYMKCGFLAEKLKTALISR